MYIHRPLTLLLSCSTVDQTTHLTPTPPTNPNPTNKQELPNWAAIMDRVRRGEQRIARNKEIRALLDEKVSPHKNPWLTLKINYGPQVYYECVKVDGGGGGWWVLGGMGVCVGCGVGCGWLAGWLLPTQIFPPSNPQPNQPNHQSTKITRLFSDEEDVFLLILMHRFEYGNWERIRLEIRKV